MTGPEQDPTPVAAEGDEPEPIRSTFDPAADDRARAEAYNAMPVRRGSRVL